MLPARVSPGLAVPRVEAADGLGNGVDLFGGVDTADGAVAASATGRDPVKENGGRGEHLDARAGVAAGAAVTIVARGRAAGVGHCNDACESSAR